MQFSALDSQGQGAHFYKQKHFCEKIQRPFFTGSVDDYARFVKSCIKV